jgi:hypothetical protein
MLMKEVLVLFVSSIHLESLLITDSVITKWAELLSGTLFKASGDR